MREDYDQQLNIQTEGDDYPFPASVQYHRYEPTNYEDLKRLVETLRPLVNRHDEFIDFGSGLMRVPIFINDQLEIRTKGIELNKALFLQGQENVRRYHELNPQSDISALHVNALDYQFSGSESILFFFNPFSAQIFMSVLHSFLSVYHYNRRTFVVLYYAKKEYIDVIQQFDLFEEIHRIELTNYINDDNELIIIYKIG